MAKGGVVVQEVEGRMAVNRDIYLEYTTQYALFW